MTRGLLDLVNDHFDISRGHPLPLGATSRGDGINFSVYAEHATALTLVLFGDDHAEPMAEFPLDPRFNRTGNVWHALVRGLDASFQYGYRAGRAGDHSSIHRFDARVVLIDPYARAVDGGTVWGQPARRRSVIASDDFDWGFDQPLNIPVADSVIYELHVRAFTAGPASGVARPGTFAGLVEKIPYLCRLGITAVQLLPVAEFDETANTRRNPATGEPLLNLWGYQPIAFFAPKASYAADRRTGGQVPEFKAMVKAFHAAGIEVILDVVFNHTGEGPEDGPTISLRGLDNATYYLIDPVSGRYRDYSGCGNTLNCNQPVVRDLVLDCLRYWVTEMHVDGFRFDLASILGRGRDGAVLPNPPLLEAIAADPVLGSTKLIAEAWDAGCYQVGTFPAWGRWAELNDRFRDDIRRFVRGDGGMVSALAARLSGSADLYQASARGPEHSVNFVTSHDGFTLADLVAYDRKHNEANGEANRDGHDDNLSWSCGVEGPTTDPAVTALRRRQARNFLTLLFVAQGVPMLLAGDETHRTQRGNNNAYCQDNELGWIDWRCASLDDGLGRFVRRLITFRRAHRLLRRTGYQHGDGRLVWHGRRCDEPDWSSESRSLALEVRGEADDASIYVAANAHWEAHHFALPARSGRRWHRVVDTTHESPHDFTESATGESLPDQAGYLVGPRSVVMLLACRSPVSS